VAAQATFPVAYKGKHIGTYAADLVVDGRLLVEIKWVWLLWNDGPFDGIKPSLIPIDVELPVAIKVS